MNTDTTIESFISKCDNMMIAEESLIDKKKDPLDMWKPYKINQDSKNIENIKKCYESIKNGHLDTYGYLLDVLRTFKVNKASFNDIAKKSISSNLNTSHMKYCKMDDDGKPNTHVEEIFNKLQIVVVDADGGGNCLLYSIKNGIFYDWNHEQNFADNVNEWIKAGVHYNKALI